MNEALTRRIKEKSLYSLIYASQDELFNNETRIDVALDYARPFNVTKSDLESVLSMTVQDVLDFDKADDDREEG